MQKVNNKHFILALLLIIPIFFNLRSGLYIANNTNLQEKEIFNLSLPISFFSFALISTILIFNKKKIFFFFKEKIIQVYLISFFLIFFLNIFNLDYDYKKKLFLFQFYLPLLGLIGGYFYSNKFFFLITYRILFFFFLTHLIVSLLQGKYFLVPDLFFFHIYQNFQYVNATLIFLACISLLVIRERIYKINFYLFLCLTFIYSFFCYSYSSIFFFFVSLIFLFRSDPNPKKIKYLFLFLFFLLLFFIFTLSINYVDKERFIHKNSTNYYSNAQKFEKVFKLEVSNNITSRILIMHDYILNIKNRKNYLTGSTSLNLDKQHKGAHNLFLDSFYKFGILLTIPFIYLFIFIFFSIIKETDSKKKEILIFFFIFLLIENFFKVSLKQPYSGIISYYIFAILLLQKKKFNYFG